ncbi:hypothetical protein CCHR01_18111 [Colletotrichum chrysophilum]|uniref:Secreted protein n=1 Tax=Colletotrichum chrysophilum TaxID=1836956 RepID=A0AAD9A163_9PEZI|nr:hypothetical protein CCHR01_18111 [Colletotrichum chrysophilum]
MLMLTLVALCTYTALPRFVCLQHGGRKKSTIPGYLSPLPCLKSRDNDGSKSGCAFCAMALGVPSSCSLPLLVASPFAEEHPRFLIGSFGPTGRVYASPVLYSSLHVRIDCPSPPLGLPLHMGSYCAPAGSNSSSSHSTSLTPSLSLTRLRTLALIQTQSLQEKSEQVANGKDVHYPRPVGDFYVHVPLQRQRPTGMVHGWCICCSYRLSPRHIAPN